jgi:hypothetical protein
MAICPCLCHNFDSSGKHAMLITTFCCFVLEVHAEAVREEVKLWFCCWDGNRYVAFKEYIIFSQRFNTATTPAFTLRWSSICSLYWNFQRCWNLFSVFQTDNRPDCADETGRDLTKEIKEGREVSDVFNVMLTHALTPLISHHSFTHLLTSS